LTGKKFIKDNDAGDLCHTQRPQKKVLGLDVDFGLVWPLETLTKPESKYDNPTYF